MKIVSMILVILAAVALVGCGGSGTSANVAAEPSPYMGYWAMTIEQPSSKGGASPLFYNGTVEVKEWGGVITLYGNDELMVDGTISPTGDLSIRLTTPNRGGLDNFQLSGKVAAEDDTHLGGILTSELGQHATRLVRTKLVQ